MSFSAASAATAWVAPRPTTNRELALAKLSTAACDGAMADDESAEAPGWVASYDAGLDAYAARHWHAAIGYFQAALATRGGDRPSEIFIERCRAYLAAPPADDWTPLSVLDGK